MKIGLIVPANTKISPYIQYYISFFKKHKLNFKVIVWDKKGVEDNADYTFSFKTSDSKRIKMILGHALFARKCKQIIDRENIDHLVVFTIAPLFFLGRHYMARFEGKFIADIRDDSPFRRVFSGTLKSIGNQSFTTVVSSPRYAPWFSSSIICHNADKDTLLEALGKAPISKRKDCIRIVFAGILIEPDRNIRIIDELKNDHRYRFIYIGRENDGKKKVKQYVIENGINNVEFQGEFEKSQIVSIYREQADLVNIFRRSSEINTNALPNKLYDAVMAGVPVVVFSHNQAITEYVNKYNLGIVLKDKDKIGIDLMNNYLAFDFNRYKIGRQSFLELVLSDIRRFENMLSDFIKCENV